MHSDDCNSTPPYPRSSSQEISPFETRTVGSGLTRQAVESYDFAAIIASILNRDREAAAAHLVQRAFPTPFEELERIRSWASDLLQRNHMPHHSGCIIVDSDGGWEWFFPSKMLDDHLTNPKGALWCALSFAQRDVEAMSWFAASALKLVDDMISGMEAQNVTTVYMASIKLGRLMERVWWKIKHEKYAVDGHRMMEGRSRGAKFGTAAQKANAEDRYAAVIDAAQHAWNRDASLAGRYKRTANVLAKTAHLEASEAGLKLSIERLRKLIARAHKAGELK